MASLALDQLSQLITKPENIRHVCVIGYIDHGISTLVNLLTTKASISIQSAADINNPEKGPIINSPGVSLYYGLNDHVKDEPQPYLINLITYPRNVDFS